MRQVFNVTIAGKLIALVSVLAPPLPVTLPRDRGVAAVRLADASRGQHQVDAGQHILDALALMFDAARVQ